MYASIVHLENQRRLYTGLSLALLAVILVSGYTTADSMNSGGFIQGLEKFFDYPAQIVRESVAKGWGFWALFPQYFPALIETLNIALVSTLVGGLLAVFLSLGATRNLDVPERLVPVIRRTMDVMRAFPELIIALFLIFVLGANAVPAMIAVAFHTAGALGKLFSEVNENIDIKQTEGLKAAGGSWLQRIRFGVLPQVLPNYTSYLLLRLEINVRASAILGFVGAGGIGSELSRSIGWGDGAVTAALFLMLFLTIVLIDQGSAKIRENLVKNQGGLA
jgi:phosphonate transport system permease protein